MNICMQNSPSRMFFSLILLPFLAQFLPWGSLSTWGLPADLRPHIPDDRKREGRLCLNTETFLTLDKEFPYYDNLDRKKSPNITKK